MAKRYDPILCMLVDEPTKAQDANKYVEQAIKWMKEGKGRLYILSGLKQMGLTPIDAAKYYAEANAECGYKVRDVAPATQRYINTIVDESKANAEKFVRQAEQDDDVPENELKYVYEAYNEKFGYKFHDSASALDKAIKTADGMFSKAFGEYSKGAKFKKDKFLKELASIKDAKEFASKMQTFDNELRKNLERLDEAYNVAGKDYYSARNEIRSIMDAFSKEAFSLYRKLDTK